MLEIIAKVDSIDAISEDRKQIIKLSGVVLMHGDYCEGETRSIIFLTPEEQKLVMSIFKK